MITKDAMETQENISKLKQLIININAMSEENIANLAKATSAKNI